MATEKGKRTTFHVSMTKKRLAQLDAIARADAEDDEEPNRSGTIARLVKEEHVRKGEKGEA